MAYAGCGMMAGNNGMRTDELNREACAWIVRGGIAAIENSFAHVDK